MPYCKTIEIPGGGHAIVRMSGKRPPDCRWCKQMSTKLCDYDISPSGQVTHRKTCDSPMCDAHAKSVGADRDYCPDHSESA